MSRKREKPVGPANIDLTDEALQRLTTVQRVAQVLFEREANRLARRHGVTDPRTRRFLTAAEGAGETLRALEITRESKPVDVPPEKGGAVVHGRASAPDGRGIAGLSVTLEDARGRATRAVGTSTTDTSGHYALRITPDVASKLAGEEVVLIALGKGAKGDEEVVYRAPATFTLEVDTLVQFDFTVESPLPLTPTPRPAPAPEPEPSPEKDVQFVVRGRVAGVDGNPVRSALVRVYDRFDNLIGAGLTNRKGEFAVVFRGAKISEGEQAADLQFEIVDANDKTLLSTTERVLFNADGETSVELKLEE